DLFDLDRAIVRFDPQDAVDSGYPDAIRRGINRQIAGDLCGLDTRAFGLDRDAAFDLLKLDATVARLFDVDDALIGRRRGLIADLADLDLRVRGPQPDRPG